MVTAFVPRGLCCSTGLPVGTAVYTDELVIWCVGESRQSLTDQKSLQKALSAVSYRLKDLDLSVSPSKTAW